MTTTTIQYIKTTDEKTFPVFLPRSSPDTGQMYSMIACFPALGKVHKIFGWDGSSANNRWYEYDIPTGVWTSKGNPLPVARGYYGTPFAINGNKAYVYGGCNGSTWFSDFWELDASTDTWTSKTGFGQIRGQCAMNICNNVLYIFGGYNGSTNVAEMWACDLSTFVWSQKTSASVVRVRHTGAVIGSKIYYFSGADNSGASQANMLVYDTVTNSWASITSGVQIRQCHTSISFNNKLYIMMGTKDNTASGALRDMWEYEPIANNWKKIGDFPTSYIFGTGASLNSTDVYLFGGLTNSGTYSANFWKIPLNFKTL